MLVVMQIGSQGLWAKFVIHPLLTNERVVIGVRANPVPEVHSIDGDVNGSVLHRDGHRTTSRRMFALPCVEKLVVAERGMVGICEEKPVFLAGDNLYRCWEPTELFVKAPCPSIQSPNSCISTDSPRR
jgi:hypothetical protein